jgi:aromatic-L-amino-acid/L-tryptophan decarboxylase
LRGRYSIRTCVLNHTTDRRQLERVLDFLERAEPAPAAAGTPVYGYERDRQMRATPIRRQLPGGGRSGVPAAALAAVSLFATLDEEERKRVAALARQSVHHAGETIVEQWEPSLDCYVILDGRVKVVIDGEPVGELGRDEFFGELAAIDWGAGFGYPRIASVLAIERTTLLTFPMGSMNELLRDHQAIARRIRRTAAERLSRSGS